MTVTEQRFFGLLKADDTAPGDVERFQLFYVIARTEDIWNQSARIYDVNNHCILEGWDEIFNNDSSLGKMLRRSMHLFNSYHKDVSTVKLFWGLDDYNSETMNNAQMIYCGLWDFEKEMK
jgi:hypothetical protein